jgi:WD40 repeat protein
MATYLSIVFRFFRNTLKWLLVIVVFLALLKVTAYSSEPEQMKGFIQYFEKLDAERQKAARLDGLVNTLRTSGQLHVADVVWCGDNKTLVSSGGIDTSLLVWDTQRGDVLHTLDRANGSRSIACSENGRFVASGNSAKEQTAAVRVWNIGKVVVASDIAGPFTPLDGRNNSFAKFLIFNSDNSRLYAHYVNRKFEQRLVAYEVPSWKIVSDFGLSGNLHARPTLSTHSQLYAYGLDAQTIAVINILNGVEKSRFRTVKLLPSVLAFGRDGKTIFVGGKRLYDGPHQGMPEQVIEEYSLDEGKIIRSIVTGHLDGLSAIVFRQDSDLIITASIDKTIELRNAATGSLVTTLGDKTTQIYSMDIRSDGKQAASAGGEIINIWSLQ